MTASDQESYPLQVPKHGPSIGLGHLQVESSWEAARGQVSSSMFTLPPLIWHCSSHQVHFAHGSAEKSVALSSTEHFEL